jgi:hypothetical protein
VCDARQQPATANESGKWNCWAIVTANVDMVARARHRTTAPAATATPSHPRSAPSAKYPGVLGTPEVVNFITNNNMQRTQTTPPCGLSTRTSSSALWFGVAFFSLHVVHAQHEGTHRSRACRTCVQCTQPNARCCCLAHDLRAVFFCRARVCHPSVYSST